MKDAVIKATVITYCSFNYILTKPTEKGFHFTSSKHVPTIILNTGPSLSAF